MKKRILRFAYFVMYRCSSCKSVLNMHYKDTLLPHIAAAACFYVEKLRHGIINSLLQNVNRVFLII